MGYLSLLCQLFPEASSNDYVSESEGKEIISEVFHSHLKMLHLEGFSEYEEELHSFREIVLNILQQSFAQGRHETLNNKHITRQEKDSWIRFSGDRLEAYCEYYDALEDSLFKKIGHYPIENTPPGAYYYIFNEQEPLLEEERTVYSIGATDLLRSLSSPNSNLVYFNNRITGYLSKLTKEIANLPNLAITLCESWLELQQCIKELFGNYIKRIRPLITPPEIIDYGLCWIHFTIKEVSILSSRFGNSHVTFQCRVLGASIRDAFLEDISPKLFVFNTLTTQDFKTIYSLLKMYSNKYPVKFSEQDFLNAIYHGDYSQIYSPGVMSNLKYLNKVLQSYAESPKWIESVANSLGRQVADINGSNGYNISSFVINLPYKQRVLP